MAEVKKEVVKAPKKYIKLFKEIKIQEEPAKAIFDEILDYHEIKWVQLENDQSPEGARMIKNKLVDAIMRGKMETNVHEDHQKGFQVIIHMRDGTSATFNEYNHTALEESAKCKTVKNIALMGALCDEGGVERLKQLRGPDLKLVEILSTLFLL